MEKDTLIKELLSELAYRSNEGYPILDNREHISIIAEILDEWDLTEIKNELIQNLLEADKETFTATNKDTGETSAFQSKDNRDAAIEKGTHTKKEDSGDDDVKEKSTTFDASTSDGLAYIKSLSKNDAAYQAAVKAGHIKDTESKESKDLTPREVELKKLSKLPKSESIKIDHQSADDSLAMTKKESKAQAKRTAAGEKQNVGAGTPESRAGEAMVHKGLRLVQEGKSLEEIEAEFKKLVNSDDHILNSKEGKKWVGSTMASIKKIDETVGLENIDIVSWDTDAGRTSIGVDPDLETSSDMFVRTKDGKNLGISLKKDGAVFLNNGGWKKQSDLLLGDLKSKMGEESHTQLSKAMSIEEYEADVTDRFKFISSTITEDVIKDDIERFKTDKELYKKFFGGAQQPVYERILSNPTALYKRMSLGTLNKNDQKVIAKITQMYHKKEYSHLRESQNALSQRTFEVLNSNKDAKDGMNKHIIKSMHISETLGLNKRVKAGGVDGFQTMYGIEPDGAVLNEETLVTLFGSNFQSMLKEQIKEVRDGNQSYEELEQFISDSIEIDYESGQILFKHESNTKFPLFKLQGRARGIGSAPVMEMLQTPFMAHALKMGTFNVDEWDAISLKKYKQDIEFI
jgi:hypothetical protein